MWCVHSVNNTLVGILWRPHELVNCHWPSTRLVGKQERTRVREGQHFASGGKLEIRVDQTGIQKQIKHHDCRFVLSAGHIKDDIKERERERVGQSHSRVCLLLYSFRKCIVSQSLYSSKSTTKWIDRCLT